MTLLLDLMYGLVLGVAWPFLLYRRRARKLPKTTLGEYFGRAAPSRPVASRCVWLHGVSLGEINATRTLVAELRRMSPGISIMVSSTTETGLSRARELYGSAGVFRFPLDFSFAIRRVLERVRPTVIVLMELELWPNLVEIAARRGIPIVIANGRITAEKSVRRFNWPVVRWFARRMFSRPAWVGAQEAVYAERFVRLGVPERRVTVTGSLKYDAAEISDSVAGQDDLAAAMGMDRGRPLWVCGSTGPGEEAMILRAFSELRRTHPLLQLALIPRKPERFDEVAQRICAEGFACLRRSTGRPEFPSAAAPQEPIPVFLGDTMGELRKFYSLANVVFVGRTLTPQGGSDVMEVAGLARPMVVGPFVDNFREAVELLSAEHGCVCIRDADSLAGAVDDLLKNPAKARAIGLAARNVIVHRRGATAMTVERILALADLSDLA